MKYSVILNAAHPLPVQLNALGHACVGLTHITGTTQSAMRHFADVDGTFVGSMTDHPLIVLSAKSSRHIHDVWQAADKLALAYNLFSIDMKDGQPVEQALAVAGKPIAELDIVALALFGEAQTLKGLTRRCFLFKG